MSRFQRWLYLDLLPKLLHMKRRDEEECEQVSQTKLIHCNSNNPNKCRCQVDRNFPAWKDDQEQTITLCHIGHNEVKNAFLSLDFVAKRMENRESYNKVEDDWQFAATVIDRLLLYIFSAVCLIGTCIIILQAPALYDNREPIDVKLSKLGPKIRPNLPDSFDVQ